MIKTTNNERTEKRCLYKWYKWYNLGETIYHYIEANKVLLNKWNIINHITVVTEPPKTN